MNIHYLQHVSFEDPGCILDWAKTNGHPLTGTRLFAGEKLPSLEEPGALMIMGGSMSAGDEARHPFLVEEKRFIAKSLKKRTPLLGICLGAQLLADVLGARVYRGDHTEIGWFNVRFTAPTDHPLLAGMARELKCFHWHGDTFDIPGGAAGFAASDACVNQGFIYENAVALQYHLEITESGVDRLIHHCRDELTPGPYVMNEAELRAGVKTIPELNGQMSCLLNNLIGG